MNPFVDQLDPAIVAAAQRGDRDALTEGRSYHLESCKRVANSVLAATA